MPHRFLRHRAGLAQNVAQSTVAASGTRVRTVVVHAAALADRIEALPAPGDLVARRQRLARVARLRSAVAAGEAALQSGTTGPDLADAGSDGVS